MDSKRKKTRCSGIVTEIKKCDRYVENEGALCRSHDYMKNYTLEMMAQLKLCKRCKKMKYFSSEQKTKNCGDCSKENERHNAKASENKKEKLRCHGITRSNEKCISFVKEDNNFCIEHRHMKDYTPEMMNNLTLCSGCITMHCMEEGFKQCINCRIRKQENRQKVKEDQEIDEVKEVKEVKEVIDIKIMCKKVGCIYQKSTENSYCGKHQVNQLIETAKLKGVKMCFNVIRGCRTELSKDYKFSSCQTCLEKQRIIDKAKYHENGTVENHDDNMKTCSGCGSSKLKEQFIGNRGQQTKCCFDCREIFKIADAKRANNEQRKEHKREYEKRPETMEYREKWKGKNPEKTAKYPMDYRGREASKDIDGYLKRNALQQKNYRKEHPEVIRDIQERSKNNLKSKITYYHRTAENKGLKFNLSDEKCIEYFNGACYYCGFKKFNGIDRKLSNKDYVVENCVSCCEFCNFLKVCLDPQTFVQRCEHILSNLEIIKGNFYPEAFSNHNPSSYNNYKYRATKILDKQFDLTKDEYELLIFEKCYLCGKKCTLRHRNGIDRVNNNLGYILSNCKSCCAECNYMKNNYDYDEFINQLELIYECCKDKQIVTSKCDINNKINKMMNHNKMTKEEKNRREKERKEAAKITLIEKYTNEESKIAKAKELAKNKKVTIKAKKLKTNHNNDDLFGDD
jgi:hypothetical protein